MLKYMLTTKCNRKCNYCITKNIVVEEETNLDNVKEVLWKVRLEGYKDIMITGGEPSLSELFYSKLQLIGTIFNNVYITTQNEMLLEDYLPFVKAISFSLHDSISQKVIPFLTYSATPVYACILEDYYYYRLPFLLKDLGYKGLTINEEQRKGRHFDEKQLPEIEDFSIRVNRKGKCMNEVIILPNLKIINNFTPYL